MIMHFESDDNLREEDEERGDQEEEVLFDDSGSENKTPTNRSVQFMLTLCQWREEKGIKKGKTHLMIVGLSVRHHQPIVQLKR